MLGSHIFWNWKGPQTEINQLQNSKQSTASISQESGVINGNAHVIRTFPNPNICRQKDVDYTTTCMYNHNQVDRTTFRFGGTSMLNRFVKFSFSIAEIDRCWHKLAAEEMAKYELNSPHAVYLNTLYDAPSEGITAAQLGELCAKNKADVSRMVAILEKKGLVQKVAVGNNMYRAKLILTEEIVPKDSETESTRYAMGEATTTKSTKTPVLTSLALTSKASTSRTKTRGICLCYNCLMVFCRVLLVVLLMLMIMGVLTGVLDKR